MSSQPSVKQPAKWTEKNKNSGPQRKQIFTLDEQVNPDEVTDFYFKCDGHCLTWEGVKGYEAIGDAEVSENWLEQQQQQQQVQTIFRKVYNKKTTWLDSFSAFPQKLLA